jgi:acylphosphatase
MQEITRQLVVVGRVQGVGFRQSMHRKATSLDVRGWVRNRADGNVEAVVQGAPEAVAALMAWARHGPRTAAVQRVDVEPTEGSFTSFEVRPTV